MANVYNWLTSNKLSLNLKKSNFVIFRPYQQKLPVTPKLYIYHPSTNKHKQLECREFVKYLGVLIDYKLSWNNHTDTILLKISRTVGVLSKLWHFGPFSTLISIYHSLIAPYLRYALIALGQASKSQLNKLLVLQKCALRFIPFAKLCDHAIPLFINTRILPINFLYYQLLAETISDVSSNLVPTIIQELFLPLSWVHSYSNRLSTSQNFYIKKLNLEIKKKLFLETWCQIMEWDTDQVAHTFKTQNYSNLILCASLLDILEAGDTYYEIDEIILKMKKAEPIFL